MEYTKADRRLVTSADSPLMGIFKTPGCVSRKLSVVNRTSLSTSPPITNCLFHVVANCRLLPKTFDVELKCGKCLQTRAESQSVAPH